MEADVARSGRTLCYDAAQMVAVDTNAVGIATGAAGLLLAYGLSLWHVFKSDPDDRFIRCASITVIILALTRPRELRLELISSLIGS